MNTRRKSGTRVAFWVYRIVLKAYPVRSPSDRTRMERTFLDLAVDTRSSLGLFALAWETTAECMNVLGMSVRIRLWRRERGVGNVAAAWARDVRLALRSLRTRHAWLVIAIVALGIGASTAVFSVVDSVLLTPLPYDRPGELVRVGGVREGRSGLATISPRIFFELAQRVTTLSSVAASSPYGRTLSYDGKPERVRAGLVSADFFSLLGVPPLHGRPLIPEDQTRGERVAVLSNTLWRRLFGEIDPVGQSLMLNGKRYTIVGVLPASFYPPEGNHLKNIDIWIPITHFDGGLEADLFFIDVIGRVADGSSFELVEQEMAALGTALVEDLGVSSRLMQTLRPQPLFGETVQEIGVTLWMLLGAVAFLLLIAFSNVAHFELTRASTRRRELSIRAAVGASRRDLIRQLTADGLVKGIVGGGLGLIVASLALDILLAFRPADIPRLTEITLNQKSLAFAFVVAVLWALAIGVVPYSRSAIEGLMGRERASTGDLRGGHLRDALLVVQSSLAVLLLVGAGLLINSLVRLTNVPMGFDPDRLMRMSVEVPNAFGDPDPGSWRDFFAGVADRVDAIPGVEHTYLTTGSPFSSGGWMASVQVDGREGQPDGPEGERVGRHQVSAGYLSGLGLTVLKGREILEQDREGSEPVAVINAALATRLFGKEEALGQRIIIGGDGTFTPRTIVGVVADARYDASRPGSAEHVYLPYVQFPAFAMDIIARYGRETTGLTEDMRQALWSVNPDVAPRSISTVRESMKGYLMEPGFYAWLLTSFATIAMVLAATGVFGTVAYTVEQRRREIGVRLVLGAQRSGIIGHVTTRTFWATALGLVAGLVLAIAVSRILENRLFEITPTDPVTIMAAAAMLMLIGTSAALLGASRASRIELSEALRSE